MSPLSPDLEPVAVPARAAGVALLIAALLWCWACGGRGVRDGEAPVPESTEESGPLSSLDAAPPVLAVLGQPFTGDLDAMRQRRLIRAFVTYNHTNYFIDGAQQRGVAYEALQLFQKHLNRKYASGKPPLEIVIVPVSRERLLERLAAGEADIAIGALTITDARRQLVDFSRPTIGGIKEIVVTGPAAPANLASVEDLAGQEVWVRPSSSYHESLERLNRELRQAGRPPVEIRDADENFETEDLLEMVNAGLYGITVADDYLAELWADVLPEIRPRAGLVLRDGGELGWALRKGTPELAAEVNAFVAANRRGTLNGNILFKRYVGTTRFARNAFESGDLGRFRELVPLFKTYADRYHFDWLLCAAQGYQESRLDQSVRSPVGAIGVMQVMPETASSPAVGIPNIDELEPNIHAGIKYLRWVADRYFDDPAIDPTNQMLFAFASYNAGPNRIARLRQEAATAGLDPDKWFHNVELEVARHVGREPVQYVANIFKYYVAYKSIVESKRRKADAAGPA